MITNLSIALGVISQPINILLILAGVLFGLVMGVIPGLGGVVALALLIPITYGFDPLVAFMFLAAVLGGTNYGGSVTAILLNTPGTATNAATIFDGYPMAKQGRAGEALGASAAASALGAIFGVFIIVMLIPVMREIVLSFGPPQVFLLSVFGLTIIAIVVKGNVVAGLASAGLGLLFAFHGYDPVTGTPRFTYGITYLYDGIKLIPALVGLFALGEMLNLLDKGKSVAGDIDEDMDVGAGRKKGVISVFNHKSTFFRSSIIGTVIGMVPGVGGTTANYIAYFQSKKAANDSDEFGEGDIRGVLASEASNDAKDGGGFLPTLALGIPGSASMAVLLSAFLLHGIQPGPLMLQNHMDIFTIILASLVISNILTSLIGLSLAKQLARITVVPISVLAPIVIVLAFIGVFTVDNNIYDLLVALGFGILGFGMLQSGMSRVPMVLGIVLGPIAQSAFLRSNQISGGSNAIFVSDPISIILIILTIASLFIPLGKPAMNKISKTGYI
jgi:putative tricarboxylic transport membrane protein